MKIFGREPALILSLLGPLFTVLAALNLPGLNAGQSAALAALVAAGLMAWTTRPMTPAIITGVLTAAVALFTEYQIHLSDALVGGITALALALFNFLVRGMPDVNPQDTAVSRS